MFEFRLPIFDLEQLARFARIYLNRQSQIANRKCNTKMSAFAKAAARQSSLSATTRAKTGGKGITLPLVQSDQHVESEMFLYKCASRCRFEIALEPRSANPIGKREICLQVPGSPFRGVKNSSCVMISQSFTQVVR